MRTRTQVWSVLLTGLLLAGPAMGHHTDPAADPTGFVGETVEDLRSQGEAAVPDQLLAKGDGGGPETTSHPGGVAAAVAVVVGAIDWAAKGVVHVGLDLVGILFGVMSTGAETASAAFSTVAAEPVASAGIATIVAAAVAGGVSLWTLVRRFGSLGAVPLFSRIAKSQLLDNPVRSEVFEFIQQNPGANVSEISRALDIAWGTATHHLQKLRSEKMVAIRKVANQKCYFENGGSYTPDEMELMSATKNPTAHRIASHLVARGPQCHQDISRDLGISPALVSFHMKKLLDAGVVGKERAGRKTIFSPLAASLSPSPRPARH